MKCTLSSMGIVIAACAMGACSLASGVSDLQGGARADAGTIAEDDASTPLSDGGSTSTPDTGSGDIDAIAPIDSSVPPGSGAVCGQTRCAVDDVCCVDFAGQAAPTCSKGNGCGKGSLSFECTQPSDCPASSEHALCCFSPVDDGTICSRKCDGPASKQLCNPNDANPCTDGQSCQSDITIPGYFSCR